MLFNKKTFAILCMLVDRRGDKKGVKRRIMKLAPTKIAENREKKLRNLFLRLLLPIVVCGTYFCGFGPNSQK